MQTGLAALKAEREALNEKIKNNSKDLFKAFSKDVFEQHPVLVGFNWRQYTPYFNDGDECIFEARTDYPGVRFTDGDESEYDEWYPGKDHYSYEKTGKKKVYSWGGSSDELAMVLNDKATPEEHQKLAAVTAVKSFLDNFDDDTLKAMFGDHQKITVTASGVEAEDYDHD